MKIRPCSDEDLVRIQLALGHLKRVRELLQLANCPQSLDKTRLLLKSVEGAQRHAQRRVTHTVKEFACSSS